MTPGGDFEVVSAILIGSVGTLCLFKLGGGNKAHNYHTLRLPCVTVQLNTC
jgi:hypothetical protein